MDSQYNTLALRLLWRMLAAEHEILAIFFGKGQIMHYMERQ